MTGCLGDEEVLAFALGRLRVDRQAEAHVHLDQCDTCQLLLSEAALATAATAPLQDNQRVGFNTMFRPGMLVGRRYLIRRFIARGGMGEVYDAFDQELLESVALKTVTSTACDNPAAVQALKAEVQLARRVGHPNVCRIYDFGTHVMAHTGAPISFLTMQFVKGETLGQRIRLGGALPISEARRIGRELLLGLSAAHDANVMHHDFKSDNVMLRAAGEDGVSPVILDFGLARAIDADPKHLSSASHGSLRGTFGYMAPEQLESKPYSKASDVYAFGIVWFEMLTGELPFLSSSSPALAILERVQRAAPAPSSMNPLVPRSLDTIVLGCLRRSPKDRYRTAGEVLAALDALESRARSQFAAQKLVRPAIALVLACATLSFALLGQLRHPPNSPVPVTRAVATPASLTAASAAAPAPSAMEAPGAAREAPEKARAALGRAVGSPAAPAPKRLVASAPPDAPTAVPSAAFADPAATVTQPAPATANTVFENPWRYEGKGQAASPPPHT